MRARFFNSATLSFPSPSCTSHAKVNDITKQESGKGWVDVGWFHSGAFEVRLAVVVIEDSVSFCCCWCLLEFAPGCSAISLRSDSYGLFWVDLIQNFLGDKPHDISLYVVSHLEIACLRWCGAGWFESGGLQGKFFRDAFMHWEREAPHSENCWVRNTQRVIVRNWDP
jgi:hypothetical protein